MGDADETRSAMDFLHWLVATFDVKVRTQGYNCELTDEIRAHGVESQYPESVRIAPLPWANSLREIGFIRYLDHGRVSNVLLEEVRRDSPGPDESRVVEYLQSGRLYRTSGTVVHDRLETSSDEPTVIGRRTSLHRRCLRVAEGPPVLRAALSRAATAALFGAIGARLISTRVWDLRGLTHDSFAGRTPYAKLRPPTFAAFAGVRSGAETVCGIIHYFYFTGPCSTHT